jgi:hypothetical protein
MNMEVKGLTGMELTKESLDTRSCVGDHEYTVCGHTQRRRTELLHCVSVAGDVDDEFTWGMRCPVPVRWDKVIVPSEFGQTTTTEAPTIPMPQPLSVHQHLGRSGG